MRFSSDPAYYENINNETPALEDEPQPTNTDFSQFINKIAEQAEEIGKLKERINQLQREKGKNASDAQTSDIANAG